MAESSLNFKLQHLERNTVHLALQDIPVPKNVKLIAKKFEKESNSKIKKTSKRLYLTTQYTPQLCFIRMQLSKLPERETLF